MRVTIGGIARASPIPPLKGSAVVGRFPRRHAGCEPRGDLIAQAIGLAVKWTAPQDLAPAVDHI